MAKVVCIGEVMWDCLPAGLFMGGTSANEAQHAARLGMESVLLTAVGDDFLGEEALRRLKAQGVDITCATICEHASTGTVGVEVSSSGEPTFTIHRGRAWEHIPLTDAAKARVRETDFLVYGSLIPHTDTSRATLEALLQELRPGARAVLDINLRPHFDNPASYRSLATPPTLLKLNEDELAVLLRDGGNPAALDSEEAILKGARWLQKNWPVPEVCVTLGARGAVFLARDGSVFRGRADPVEVIDAVGAGDAFLAALLAGLAAGAPQRDADFVSRACRLGALVASRAGAVPDYDPAPFLA